MPRKVYRKRRVNRKYIRSKKKKYARRNYMGASGKRFFKLRLVTSFDTSAAGILNYAWTSNPSSYQDWTSVSSLFDTYRTCAIKLKYIPHAPNDTTSTVAFQPVYVIGDPDSSSAPISAINDAVQYENLKVKNLYRPWTHYYKFPKLSSTGGSNVVLNKGYTDCANPTSIGLVQAYTNNLSLSTTYGTVISTLYIVARGRR